MKPFDPKTITPGEELMLQREIPITVEEGFKLWLSNEDLSKIERPIAFTREDAEKYAVDFIKDIYSAIKNKTPHR